jgi:peroxiredoxin
MVELGQLEAHQAEFAARGVRVVAASMDDVADTAATHPKFPHLTVVSDAGEALAKAAAVVGPQHSPSGGDTVAPTTVLIDAGGRVRWVFRPDRYINRLTPQDLLAAIDAHLR